MIRQIKGYDSLRVANDRANRLNIHYDIWLLNKCFEGMECCCVQWSPFNEVVSI